MGERRQEHEIEIAAAADIVWKAITEADELTRWFVEEAKVTPGEGGTQWVSWGQGIENENHHLVWKPGAHLRLGAPEGQVKSKWDLLVLDYTIETRDGKTILRLVQTTPDTPDWEGIYDGTDVGWTLFMQALKFYLENHPGQPRRTVFRYGPLAMSREKAWSTMLGPCLLSTGGGLENAATGKGYASTAATGDALQGRVLLCDRARNFSASVEGFGDALLSFDLSGKGDECFMNFTLGTFGLPDETYGPLAERWNAVFDGLFATPAPTPTE